MKYFFSLLLISLLNFSNIVAQELKPDISNISVFDVDWSLYVNLKNYKTVKNDISPDGKMRQIAAMTEAGGMTVSVFIEPAEREGDAKICRAFYEAKVASGPMGKLMKKVEHYEDGSIAFVEYDIFKLEGKRINHHSLNAYLSVDGYWIDVHMSKEGYDKLDKSMFDDIVKSIKVNRPKVYNFMEQFMQGALAFYSRDYSMAIKVYSEALATQSDLQKTNNDLWRTTVDNLGMAYGVTGKLESSVKVYEEAIPLDPEYPMFYYSLACGYAELLNLDKSIENLDKAWSYKDNMIKGETLPNPMYDSSFAKHKEDEKFRAWLKNKGL